MSALNRLLWLDHEGSTRLAGLLRIALVLLLWATWSYPFILHFDLHPLRLSLALAFYLASPLLLVGLWTPASAAVVAASLVGASLLLGPSDPLWLQPHRQLATLLACLGVLLPAGRSLSLDRLRALRRARQAGRPAPDERGPLWPLRLLQLVASCLLLATALGQLSPAWRDGSALSAAPAWGRPVAWGLLLVHLVGAFGPWWRVTRTASLLLVGGVYLGLGLFMVTDTVPFAVIWLLCAFLDPQTVHRAIDRLHGHPG